MVALLFYLLTVFLYFVPICVRSADDKKIPDGFFTDFGNESRIMNGTITIDWDNVIIHFETNIVKMEGDLTVKNFGILNNYDSIEATCGVGNLSTYSGSRFWGRCDCLLKLKFAKALLMNSLLLDLQCAINAEIETNGTIQPYIQCILDSTNDPVCRRIILPDKSLLTNVLAKLDQFYTGGLIPGSACGITGLSPNSSTIRTNTRGSHDTHISTFSISIPALHMLCYFEMEDDGIYFWNELNKGVENATTHACKSVPPSDIRDLKQFVKNQTQLYKVAEQPSCIDELRVLHKFF